MFVLNKENFLIDFLQSKSISAIENNSNLTLIKGIFICLASYSKQATHQG